MSITVPFVNTYFDFDDYDNPVQTFIDDRFYIETLPGYTKTNLAYVQ